MKTWYADLKKEEMENAINKLLKTSRMPLATKYLIRIGIMHTSKSDLFSIFYKQRKQLEKILNK